MPTAYTVAQVLADPVGPNSRLSTYTNFVNLLDLAGMALPASMKPDGTPFGVTLLAAGGYVVANQPLDVARWTRLPECEGVPKDRYFLYRVA